MEYSVMTTEKLLALQSAFEDQISEYVSMSFQSPRSDLVSYEIDSIDSDEIVITANHYFNGLIRDYTVTISDSVDDDVEYNHYNADEEIVDGGYMSFDRLPKAIREAVCEIYALYKKLSEINNILDTRLDTHDYEEEEEEATEEEEEEDVINYDEMTTEQIADVLGFSGFDYDDAKSKLKNDHRILDTHAEEEEEEEVTEEETKEEEEVEVADKGAHIMKRFEVYNAYTVNRDFRYIANALRFTGFNYDHFDDYFKTKLEQDEELGDLLEQLEDIESSQFLIYTCTKVRFYERHEYDILSYLRTYGYDDNNNLQSIEDIMCSRVIAYVTGVLSEYGY